MKEITLKTVAKVAGISYEAVRKRRNKEGWKSSGTVNLKFSKAEVFKFIDLPSDIRSLFSSGNHAIADGDKALSQGASALSPFCRQGQNCWGSAPVSRSNVQETTITAAPTDGIPDEARAIALAKMDLVRAWLEYRKDSASLTEADKEFLAGYNAGILYKNLREILGEIRSINTLRRWDEALSPNFDWTALVPLHFLREPEGPQLNPAEREVVLRVVLTPHKLRIGTAIRLTKTVLKNIGVPTAKSDRTFRRFIESFRAKNNDLWTFVREGQKALRDKVEPFITRDPSLLEVGQVLVADGHRLNFQVINPHTGKPCRATMVAYLDWKSYYLVGYEIMCEENRQCIASALRDAIIHLGKKPQIVYQDNGKAFRARFFTSTESLEETGFYGLFGRLNIMPVFARPYNARAKIIERWFRELDTCERLIPSFVGSSIEDKPAWLLRNEPFHKAIKNGYVPTIGEAFRIIDAWHEWHRQQPCPHVDGKTIGEVFDAGKGPGVNVGELDELMMAVQVTKIGRNGVRFLNADYYNDELYGLREGAVIRYSLSDLSSVKVYDLRNNFLCKAERRMSVHPMAQHLGDAKDQEQLKALISQQRRLERKTVQEAKRFLSAGVPVELDWQKIISVAPKTIEKLEQENIELPGIPESIPDEAVRPKGEDSGTSGGCPVPAQESEEKARPSFWPNAISRYQWHRDHGFTTESDWTFKKEFEETDDYRMAFKFFEEQKRREVMG